MIPIVASAEDLPEAFKFASLRPTARWYVATRAQALGHIDDIPTDWHMPLTAAVKQYSDEQRAQFAKDKVAMPDGSYPVPDRAHLAAALSDYNRTGQDEAVKKHLIQRAVALHATSDLPPDWVDPDNDGDNDLVAAQDTDNDDAQYRRKMGVSAAATMDEDIEGDEQDPGRLIQPDAPPVTVVMVEGSQPESNDGDDERELDEEEGNDPIIASAELMAIVAASSITQAERDEGVKNGNALDDGSYLIRNKRELRNAINLRNHGNQPRHKIYAHIRKRAKALGATKMLPSELVTGEGAMVAASAFDRAMQRQALRSRFQESTALVAGIAGRIGQAFDEALHPRGRDGKFINVGGHVQELDSLGHPTREGKVTGITKLNDGSTVVHAVDSSGKAFDAAPKDLRNAPGAEAHINVGDSVVSRDTGHAHTVHVSGDSGESEVEPLGNAHQFKPTHALFHEGGTTTTTHAGGTTLHEAGVPHRATDSAPREVKGVAPAFDHQSESYEYRARIADKATFGANARQTAEAHSHASEAHMDAAIHANGSIADEHERAARDHGRAAAQIRTEADAKLAHDVGGPASPQLKSDTEKAQESVQRGVQHSSGIMVSNPEQHGGMNRVQIGNNPISMSNHDKTMTASSNGAEFVSHDGGLSWSSLHGHAGNTNTELPNGAIMSSSILDKNTNDRLHATAIERAHTAGMEPNANGNGWRKIRTSSTDATAEAERTGHIGNADPAELAKRRTTPELENMARMHNTMEGRVAHDEIKRRIKDPSLSTEQQRVAFKAHNRLSGGTSENHDYKSMSDDELQTRADAGDEAAGREGLARAQSQDTTARRAQGVSDYIHSGTNPANTPMEQKANVEGFRKGMLSGDTLTPAHKQELSKALDEHLASGGKLEDASKALAPLREKLADQSQRDIHGGKENYWAGFSKPGGPFEHASPNQKAAAREAFDAGWKEQGPNEALKRAREALASTEHTPSFVNRGEPTNAPTVPHNLATGEVAAHQLPGPRYGVSSRRVDSNTFNHDVIDTHNGNSVVRTFKGSANASKHANDLNAGKVQPASPEPPKRFQVRSPQGTGNLTDTSHRVIDTHNGNSVVREFKGAPNASKHANDLNRAFEEGKAANAGSGLVDHPHPSTLSERDLNHQIKLHAAGTPRGDALRTERNSRDTQKAIGDANSMGAGIKHTSVEGGTVTGPHRGLGYSAYDNKGNHLGNSPTHERAAKRITDQNEENKLRQSLKDSGFTKATRTRYDHPDGTNVSIADSGRVTVRKGADLQHEMNVRGDGPTVGADEAMKRINASRDTHATGAGIKRPAPVPFRTGPMDASDSSLHISKDSEGDFKVERGATGLTSEDHGHPRFSINSVADTPDATHGHYIKSEADAQAMAAHASGIEKLLEQAHGSKSHTSPTRLEVTKGPNGEIHVSNYDNERSIGYVHPDGSATVDASAKRDGFTGVWNKPLFSSEDTHTTGAGETVKSETAKTPTEAEVQNAKFGYAQARQRERSARGPTAMQSAIASKERHSATLKAAGYELGGNGQWKKSEPANSEAAKPISTSIATAQLGKLGHKSASSDYRSGYKVDKFGSSAIRIRMNHPGQLSSYGPSEAQRAAADARENAVIEHFRGLGYDVGKRENSRDIIVSNKANPGKA